MLGNKITNSVQDAGGILDPDIAEKFKVQYRNILREANKECPPPDESQRKGKRGRLKRSKARNLLERQVSGFAAF